MFDRRDVESDAERRPRAFAEAGFVMLVHDHRNFGASDRAERGDIDPWQQIADWRHAIVLGATDRRLRAVVAQVPTISGFEQVLRRVPPEGIASLEKTFTEDDRGQLRGEPLHRQLIVSDDLTVPASYHSKDAIEFYLQPTCPGT